MDRNVSFFCETPKNDENSNVSTSNINNNLSSLSSITKKKNLQIKRNISQIVDTTENTQDPLLLIENLDQLVINKTKSHLMSYNRNCSTPIIEYNSNPSTSKNSCNLSNTILSPIKESREILYRNIPSRSIPKRRRLIRNIEKTQDELLMDIINNKLIMSIIFQYLSDGDLYRFSMVSIKFKNAISNDFNANERYILYKEIHQVNKENYQITPPGTPERIEVVKNLWNSGASQIFCEFVAIGQTLNREERLEKCIQCGHPSVIIKNIGQCQYPHCRYIYCKICSSYSNDPKTFIDSCNRSQLDRSKLSDLSNNGSFVDSGFYSINDTPIKSSITKRKLFDQYESSMSVTNRKNQQLNNKNNKSKTLKIPVTNYIPIIQSDNKKSPSPSPTSPSKNRNSILARKRRLKRLLL